MARILDIILRGSDKTAGAFDSVEARTRKAEGRFSRFGAQSSASFNTVRRAALATVAGITAIGGAMFAAAKRTEVFNKQIGQVATLADISIPKVKSQVKDLSAEFGLAKDELTKGLYDALSAGVPKDNALEFLRTAAQGAVAGAASTAESVDILTTALNAFQIPAREAGKVSDTLFATIKLGKTTMSELAQSFAQVAPLAAASGVSLQQVLAAAATLTKQGTPTAQAMTQIRSALVSMNEHLGDGWSKTMTLQEGMQAMSEMAGGSADALKKLTGRVEGTLGILGMTGTNASMAASDLEKVQNSADATAEAFKKMDDQMILSKGQQAIDNLIITLGEATFAEFADDIDRLTDALVRMERDGDIREFARDLAEVMGALGKAGEGVAFLFGGARKLGTVGGAFATAMAEQNADAKRRMLEEGRWGKMPSLTDNVFTRTAELLEKEASAEAHRRAGDLLPDNIKDRLMAGELTGIEMPDLKEAMSGSEQLLREQRDDVRASRVANEATAAAIREAISFSR